jgi:hypothetical protein
MNMATQNQDPDFYKNYSATDIKMFEEILRHIHSADPNPELAKKMVMNFQDNGQLERFRGFKSEFENALKVGQNKVKTSSEKLDNLEERRTQLVQQKNDHLKQGVKRVSDELKLDKHSIKPTQDKKPKH